MPPPRALIRRLLAEEVVQQRIGRVRAGGGRGAAAVGAVGLAAAVARGAAARRRAGGRRRRVRAPPSVPGVTVGTDSGGRSSRCLARLDFGLLFFVFDVAGCLRCRLAASSFLTFSTSWPRARAIATAVARSTGSSPAASTALVLAVTSEDVAVATGNRAEQPATGVTAYVEHWLTSSSARR